MRVLSKLTGGLLATALVAAAATPASARGWWGPPRYYHHDDTGAIVGAIVGIGLIAAIASAASSSKNAPPPDDRRYDAPPPQSGNYDNRYDDRGPSDGANYDSRSNPPRVQDARGVTSGEDAAVNACVTAARDQASRNGDYVEIRGVDNVAAKGSGWDVAGSVDQRSSYRAKDGWSRNFRCSWQDGQVSGLSLD